MIFDHEQGAYYGSGPVGAVIWSLIEEDRQVSEIFDLLVEQFEVDRVTCETEVLAFLSDLRKRGLIEVR